jgi:acetyl esterase/lipase
MAVLLATAVSVGQATAAEAEKLLPAGTEMILSVNVRQILEDQKNLPGLGSYLEQWRLAIQNDVKQLTRYHHAQDLLKKEGLSEEGFIERARRLKAVTDALGVDLLQDVDRISCTFRLGDPKALVILVEGRFDKDRLHAALPRLVKEHFGTCETRHIGEHDVWQVPGGGDGTNLCVLSPKALAITLTKKSMEELLSCAEGKQAGLSERVRTLLKQARKEHIVFLMDHVRVLKGDSLKALKAAAGRAMGPGATVGNLVLDQAVSLIEQYSTEVSAVSGSLSFGEAELRLQGALVLKRTETAKNLAAAITASNLSAALALSFVDGEVPKQLADILQHVRVVREGESLIVNVRVPYSFFEVLLRQPWQAGMALAYSWYEAGSRSLLSIPLWGPVRPQPGGACEVEVVHDVTYHEDRTAAAYRHQMDLFLPKGKKGYPIVVVVHGGSWIVGDNRCCGLYSTVGHFLASQGIGAVLPNYRLSPAVKHPEHVKDVARAVRWARNNMARHGGNPERLFLLGHSAGAHLVSLLATDESYLQEQGMKTTDIQGVIAVSGVYRIPPGPVEVSLGGSGPRALRLNQLFPFRGEGLLPELALAGAPIHFNLFGPAFGDDPGERERASPVAHVRRGLPSFLIVFAKKDLPALPEMAAELHRALRREGQDAQLLEAHRRNHNSVLFTAIVPDDPTARAILEFVRQRGKK